MLHYIMRLLSFPPGPGFWFVCALFLLCYVISVSACKVETRQSYEVTLATPETQRATNAKKEWSPPHNIIVAPRHHFRVIGTSHQDFEVWNGQDRRIIEVKIRFGSSRFSEDKPYEAIINCKVSPGKRNVCHSNLPSYSVRNASYEVLYAP